MNKYQADCACRLCGIRRLEESICECGHSKMAHKGVHDCEAVINKGLAVVMCPCKFFIPKQVIT